MNDRERRVRDEAHRIWIEEGRPEGAEHRHWAEAERRVAADDGEKGLATGKPKGGKRQKPPKAGAKGAAGAVTGDLGKAAAKKAAGKTAVGKPAVGKQAEALVKRKRSAGEPPQVEGAAALPAPGPAAGKRKPGEPKPGKAKPKVKQPSDKKSKAPPVDPERRSKSATAAKSGKAKA